MRRERIGDYKAVAMSEEASVQSQSNASHTPAVTRGWLWLDRIARAFGQTNVPFEIYFPDGASDGLDRACRASVSG